MRTIAAILICAVLMICGACTRQASENRQPPAVQPSPPPAAPDMPAPEQPAAIQDGREIPEHTSPIIAPPVKELPDAGTGSPQEPVSVMPTIRILCDFEQESALKDWSINAGESGLTGHHAADGAQSLRIAGPPAKGNMHVRWDHAQDWTGFDSLALDVFVDGDAPVKVAIIVSDKEAKGYWDWHNSWQWLRPGTNCLSLPAEGLFRGEAGAHKADLKSNLDTGAVTWFAFTFTSEGGLNALYIDSLRLMKTPRPEGIRAFDFGPAGQAVAPGFTAITLDTIYGQNGTPAGMQRPCGNRNRARDDTFPTRLYQDFVLFEPDNEFIVDMPDGMCHVWLVFSDCGFWDGEQARHKQRTVFANGRECWTDNRGEEGPTDYLFRFENIEPHPGDSMWDLYMQAIFHPVRFNTHVTGGQLRIRCSSDAWWSTKVAAIIIYPDTIRETGAAWVQDIEKQNRAEFEDKAVFLGPGPQDLEVPADAAEQGFWLGFPALEDTVSLLDAPGPAAIPPRRAAVRGQRIHFTFAVRPLQDFPGSAGLTCTPMQGPAGTIPAECLDPRYVHHLTTRRPNQIAYRIVPNNLRRIGHAGLRLTKGLTRQFVVILDVPEKCGAGIYTGTARLTAGSLDITVPLSFEVLDLKLDEPDFPFGFFGFNVPSSLPESRRRNGVRELAAVLRQHGMNSYAGGPYVKFSGLDEAGRPQLDFAACDEFFKQMRSAGFNQQVFGPGAGSVTGLHDHYAIGTAGRAWETKTGRPFNELLRIVWTAVREHAEREGWPTTNYYMIEEPGAIGQAKATLELAQAYREAVPEVRFGGYYSVHWEQDKPFDQTIRELFGTAFWSGLNVHNQTDLDKAREAGRELYIYNQGLSRYSFGAYQFAEMRKGIKGRIQWHTLALYGNQFFDLDSREPDTGIINWGRDGIIPTLNLARCCEGAADFRFAVTLWNRAQANKKRPEAEAALAFLDNVNRAIPAGQRTAPPAFMTDEAFRNACADHLRKIMTAGQSAE